MCEGMGVRVWRVESGSWREREKVRMRVCCAEESKQVKRKRERESERVGEETSKVVEEE